MRSPLAEAGLTKDEVRAWSEAYGLPTWDKPQMACLASRIPYGTPVTPERLAQVERAEAGGARARVPRLPRARTTARSAASRWRRRSSTRAFARRADARRGRSKGAGFRIAALDLEPFRSGRMNEVAGIALPVVPG